MQIVIKIRLDQQQAPYWSARLMHKNDVVVECYSKTFNPRDKVASRKNYMETVETIYQTLRDNPDFDTILHMLIQD